MFYVCLFYILCMLLFIFESCVFLLLCLCILIVMYALFCIFCFHRANWHSSATFTEGFPCFSLSCKPNARVLFSFVSYLLLLLCLCILIVMYALFCMFCFHRANWHSSATLTEVFPCFFLSCKANARVYLAKTGHGPHSSQLVYCVVPCIVCLDFV